MRTNVVCMYLCVGVFQSEEDRGTLMRMQEVIGKLQSKVKIYKRQAESAVSGLCVLRTTTIF